MKLQDIDFGKGNGISLHLVHDLSDTEVRFGDYIRLHGLLAGDLIYLRDDGSGQKIVLIGNATNYNGVSSVSDEGWDWGLYNNWIVERVFHFQLEANGSFLHPTSIRIMKEEASAGGRLSWEITS